MLHDKESQNKRERSYTNCIKNWWQACDIKNGNEEQHPEKQEIYGFSSDPEEASAKNKIREAGIGCSFVVGVAIINAIVERG